MIGRRSSLLALLLLLAAGTQAAEPVLSAPLPNRWIPQGELRLFATADETRIEVALHTRFLDRVLKAITEKETANWGAHPDARRYLAALTAAREQLRAQSNRPSHETLLIEFIDARTGGVVRLSSTQLPDAAPLDAFAPDPDYLRRNMALILADRLDLTEAEARARIDAAQPDPHAD